MVFLEALEAGLGKCRRMLCSKCVIDKVVFHVTDFPLLRVKRRHLRNALRVSYRFKAST